MRHSQQAIDEGLDPDVEAMAFEYGLPLMFPTEVLRQSSGITPGDAESGPGRRDLRGELFVTIDGDDARDFDDAVHCEADGNGHMLTVAIADVSAYVSEGGGIDQEARARATSAYFPATVLPMLPPALSEDLCSLRQDEDRNCLACRMWVNGKGIVKKSEFFECVIRSRARLTYRQAQDAIDGNPARDDEIGRTLAQLAGLCGKLEKLRSSRGGFQMEMPSVVPVIEGGAVKGFSVESRLFTHRLIEECMLLANTCAAGFLSSNDYPFLYRIHPKPSDEKRSRLKEVLVGMGAKGFDVTSPQGLMKIAGKFSKRPPLVHRVMAMNIVRTLEKAVYTPVNIGHYGLGYEEYTHFTSPIRRYPDLTVHRAIKAVLRGERPPKGLRERLAEIGRHCTEREIAAERASLNVISRKLGRTMSGRVGQVLDGVVTGMSKGGMFVAFENGCEGMARFSAMDDYYVLSKHMTSAAGRRTGRVLHVGMEVSARVASVNDEDGRCQLELE